MVDNHPLADRFELEQKEVQTYWQNFDVLLKEK
jgi:hypothetical protein